MILNPGLGKLSLHKHYLQILMSVLYKLMIAHMTVRIRMVGTSVLVFPAMTPMIAVERATEVKSLYSNLFIIIELKTLFYHAQPKTVFIKFV